MPRLLLALLVLSAALFAGELDLSQPLPVDPEIKMGTLPNGLRYWIRPNATPPGKVSLMLHIHSGSLNETDAQRGLAHFLEHMAFNGSANFAPGEMVKFFESLGMKFGQHQNAFTSFDQTTYMMRLPDTKAETVQKVLLYFADVGSRLSLVNAEIEKERGVILEEARARKGMGQRVTELVLPIALPGSRVAQRMPIGLEEVITGAPRERFVEYYQSWYRPGNATFIACGDIEPEAIEKAVREAFKDWKPVAEPKEHEKPGIQYDTALRAGIVTDPELTQAQIGVSALSPLRRTETVGDFRTRRVEGIGTRIVNRRLRELLQKGEAPYQGASVSVSSFFNLARSVDVNTSGQPEKWKEMLSAVIREVRRAVEHGFTDDEFADAKKAILSNAERAAEAEPTRNSFGLLQSMNGAITRGTKPMSRAQALELTRAILPTITLKEVHATFQAAFLLDHGLVLATLPEKEGFALPTEKDLLDAMRAAVKAEVAKGAERKQAAGLLEKDPEPVAVVEESEDAELAILTSTLANGVVLHTRSMDFKKDSVLVRVRFFGGGFDETAATLGLTMAGGLALSGGSAASKRHSSTDISDLLTGKKFNYGGGPAEGSLVFQLDGSPEDLEDGFRLLHVLLTEPRLEQATLDRWKQQMELMYPNFETSPRFQAGNAVSEFLSGGDPRFVPPPLERVQSITVQDAQQWLENVLRTAPIEASIVGDMKRARMVELARRYLGTLPKRPVARADLAELRKVEQKAGPHVRVVDVSTITPQAVVNLGWRGTPYGERTDFRIMLFASQILSTRLTKAIREDRGLTYSIGVRATPSSVFDGMGRLSVGFTADPEKAEEAAKVARQVVEEFVEQSPPTDAEMGAVHAQLENVLSTQLEQPGFWSNILSSLRTRGRSLDELKSLQEAYGGITKEQIAAVLKRYVVNERYFQVVAKPTGAPK